MEKKPRYYTYLSKSQAKYKDILITYLPICKGLKSMGADEIETFRDFESSRKGIYNMFETSRPQNLWVQVHPLHPLVWRPCIYVYFYKVILGIFKGYMSI